MPLAFTQPSSSLCPPGMHCARNATLNATTEILYALQKATNHRLQDEETAQCYHESSGNLLCCAAIVLHDNQVDDGEQQLQNPAKKRESRVDQRLVWAIHPQKHHVRRSHHDHSDCEGSAGALY